MNSKKRVLILSTSPRKNGNSRHAWRRNLPEAPGRPDMKWRKSVCPARRSGFCQGCLACQKTGRCVIHDDADAIVQEKMVRAQVLVFATPIYYYEMCGQMKTMLDRSNPLYSSDYAFREVYLLATAAEDGDEVCSGRQRPGGLGRVLPQGPHGRVVFGGGATEVGAIRGSDAMKRAYEAGKAL